MQLHQKFASGSNSQLSPSSQSVQKSSSASPTASGLKKQELDSSLRGGDKIYNNKSFSDVANLNKNPSNHSKAQSIDGSSHSSTSNRLLRGMQTEASYQRSSRDDVRKSSVNKNGNLISSSKMILPWNPAIPDEWNTTRIVHWLKYYSFPQSWCDYFERKQIKGNDFIKLLAYEHFKVHERYLITTKNASFTRFQQLLKDTLSNNVMHNHGRQKSAEKAKLMRASSESIKLDSSLSNSSEDTHSIRSSSDSFISGISGFTESKRGKDTDTYQPQQMHKKNKSTGYLYRRSFISLKNPSNSSASSTKSSNIKLNIPSQSSNGSSSRVSSAQSSPSIFRKHQKSNSSDSSILNFLFGSTSNSGQGNGNSFSETSTIAEVEQSSRSSSSETLPKATSLYSKSSNKPSPNNDEKTKLWEKFKRKSQANLMSNSSTYAASTKLRNSTESSTSEIPFSSLKLNDNSANVVSASTSKSQTLPLTQKMTNTDTKISESNSDPEKSSKSAKNEDANNEQEVQPTIHKTKEHQIMEILKEKNLLPAEYFEAKNQPCILISRNNKSFVPLRLKPSESIQEYKEQIVTQLAIKSNNYSIHVTEFFCDYGPAISDDLLEKILSRKEQVPMLKLYVKDLVKTTPRSKNTPISAESTTLTKALRRKASSKSISSNNANSFDQNSLSTSYSDLNSFDDHHSSTGKRYPRTPNNYYEGTATNGDEINYWNFKDCSSEDSILPKLISKPKTIATLSERIPLHFSSPEQDQYKASPKSKTDLIDNEVTKRIVQSELAPKREAPKAPTNQSPSKNRSISRKTSSLKLRKSTSKLISQQIQKNNPPPLNTNLSTKSVIASYTPGSSHVLVPQPYKGAPDASRETGSGSIPSNVAHEVKSKKEFRANSFSSVLSVKPGMTQKTSARRIVSSTSAADVFEENAITFSDAPEFSDSDSNDSIEEILWLNEKKKSLSNELDEGSSDTDSSSDLIWSANKKPIASKSEADVKLNNVERKGDAGDMIFKSPDDSKNGGIMRKMTLRPSPEEVYKNLERFFPSANLDKPVFEGVTPPTSPNPIRSSVAMPSPSSETLVNSSVSNLSANGKSSIASSKKTVLNSPNTLKRTKTIRAIAHEANETRKLKRHNTKMWGTRIFEVTDKQTIPINKSKNSKGEYNEFAWMKGEMIGKGSFGAVFLSLNITTGEMMAVKQVEVPKYGLQSEEVYNNVEALRSEVSTLKNLDHLNIVQYLGFEVKNNIYSLFLEYVAGGSVGSLIRLYGRFDDVLIRHLTNQILQGLAYLHSRGILHRDMKADNLLLDQDGVCKISDFGISRKSNDVYENSEMTMRGTVFWMAPEMVDTKQGYSAKVDIWSLGCIVLEMFAGKRPWSNFEVVTAMFKIGQAKSAPPIPEDTLPLISDVAKQFLDKCFEINFEKRPTADTLLSHEFSKVDATYDFKKTRLAKFIKSNDKISSSKLRVSS